MRMWLGVDKMCSQHRSGEHYEIHKFIGAVLKGKSVKGYLEKRLVFPTMLKVRHDALAAGMNHNSPVTLETVIEVLKKLQTIPRPTLSDYERNQAELIRRCPKCRAKMGERNSE